MRQLFRSKTGVDVRGGHILDGQAMSVIQWRVPQISDITLHNDIAIKVDRAINIFGE